MIKRDITETVCEYDNEGKLVKKTITETHEEEVSNYPSWTFSSDGTVLCSYTTETENNTNESELYCTCNCSNK